MSALRNVLKKSSSRIDGTVAVLIVGSAIVFSSGLGLANASSQDAPVTPTHGVVNVDDSAGKTITISGSTGIDIP